MKKHMFEQYLNNIKYRSSVDVLGKSVRVPVVYSELRAIMVFLPISLKKAKEAVGLDRFKPVSILNDKSLLGITIFDYVDCDVGPYRELAFSIPVLVDSKFSIPLIPLKLDFLFKKYGFYSILLAMNTNIARIHSEKIFGYPTFSKNIKVDIEDRDDWLSVKSEEGGRDIVAISIKKPDRYKVQKKKFNTYFVQNNDKLSVVEMDTLSLLGNSRNKALIEFGDHEISTIIKNLSVELKSLESIYYKNAVEVLSLPRVI